MLVHLTWHSEGWAASVRPLLNLEDINFLQALDKMDKAGALGSASDRSKPVSWNGASLQVCPSQAAKPRRPLAQQPVLHVCRLGQAHQPAARPEASDFSNMPLPQVNVDQKTFGRGETGTTTDQVRCCCSAQPISS
jgi:hypothetical protein